MDNLQRAGRDFLIRLVAQHGPRGAARVLADELEAAGGGGAVGVSNFVSNWLRASAPANKTGRICAVSIPTLVSNRASDSLRQRGLPLFALDRYARLSKEVTEK
jgi:hypothetical protein